MTERPLAGMTAIEIGHSVAAPYAGVILAELGAEVIKVERPDGGDPARDWPPYHDGSTTTFNSLNRSKRAVAVDFNDPAQLARLKAFILERADIVVQNLRAGAIERAGLGGRQLLELKPSLIYANLNAFGAVGPMKDRPGYDPLMQAFGGIMSVTGESPDRPPVRVGVSIIDMGTALWTVIGILAALTERGRTGRGGVIDTSLFETALAWMTIPIMMFQASGQLPQPQGSGRPEIVPYQAFATADGHLMVAAGNDNLFRLLCKALERPDLAADARFMTNGVRTANRAILVPELEKIFLTRTADQWAQALTAAGVPNASLNNVAQVLAEPQTHALEIMRSIAGVSVPFMALPLSFDGVRPAVKGPAAGLGADNLRILGEK